jgi:uncharacterized membrane protein
MSTKKIFIKIAGAFYGVGIAALGIQQFVYSDFRPVILPPSWPAMLHFSIFAYIAGAALVVAGCSVILQKRAKEISLLSGAFLLLSFIFFQGPYILFVQPNRPYHLGLWTDPLKELALSGGAFVMAGLAEGERSMQIRNRLLLALEKFIPLGKIFFCITMISFGIDHFFYTEFVAGLVPAWFPDPRFCTYFGGVTLIASGVAIVLEIRVRKVAFLLSLMLFLWVVLLHIPRAIADAYIANGSEITSVFEALAFSGTAMGIMCMHRNSNSKINITLFKPSLQYEKDKQH